MRNHSLRTRAISLSPTALDQVHGGDDGDEAYVDPEDGGDGAALTPSCPTNSPTRTTGVRNDMFGNPYDVNLDVYDSGAIIARDQSTGEAIDWHGPSAYDSHGALKTTDVVEQENHCWSDLRLEQGLNTSGPEGSESSLPWQVTGLPPEAQHLAAQHDVQAAVAQVESLRRMEDNPGASFAANEMRNYNHAVVASSVASYATTMVPYFGTAERGQSVAQRVFGYYGYNVPGSTTDWTSAY